MGNINLLEEELTRDLFVDLLMPEWKDCDDIKISILSGGITNKLYRVTSEKGDLAVRIYGDKTELFINREYEAETMQKVSDLGISPKLIKYLPQYKVTIIEFITHGITLKNPDFLKEGLREKIINPIIRLHNSNIVLPKLFNPLKEIKHMYKILNNDIKANYPEFKIVETIEKLDKVFNKINISENEYTPCHNDLLAENFILVKEGYEHLYSEPLYIIDWEYGGMAPRYYDIADMFQEILVGREVEKSFVEYYCEGKNFEENLYYVEMFKPFPDIYWFLWSLIQQNISTIEFDFYNYGKAKYEHAQENLEYLKNEYNIKL